MNRRQEVHGNRSHRLARKLGAYAAGAAASVAVVPASFGAIVYTDLGPTGVTVELGAFDVDLDHNLQPDFQLLHRSSYSVSTDYVCFTDTVTPGGEISCESGTWDFTVYFWQDFKIRSAPNAGANRILKSASDRVRLDGGELIDPVNAEGQAGEVTLAYQFDGRLLEDSFAGQRGFLGVLFAIDGAGMHAGWLDVEANPNVSFAKVYGFAYETILDKPILAGDTGANDGVPGDTNADGRVDLEDLNNVRNNFGGTGSGILGDTNGDNLVDLEDLNAVRNNFGAGSAVPEPPSLVLLAAGAAGLAALRRRTRQRCQRT